MIVSKGILANTARPAHTAPHADSTCPDFNCTDVKCHEPMCAANSVFGYQPCKCCPICFNPIIGKYFITMENALSKLVGKFI